MRRKWNVACIKYVKNATKIFIPEPEGISQHGNLGVAKRMLKKCNMRCEVESSGSA
jgi:hypothetical protein